VAKWNLINSVCQPAVVPPMAVSPSRRHKKEWETDEEASEKICEGRKLKSKMARIQKI